MTHASLFSGIGGPEVAAAMLGWKNLFHCEINPFGRAVLEYWFPKSKSYEDITKTSFTEWRGKIDVLTGGFPCQPFSYAGKRGGREDERYLWPEMLRAIDEIRPTWVVGENVAGITTMVEGWLLSEVGSGSSMFAEDNEVHDWLVEQTFTIEKISKDLESLGYSVQPVLIPAAAVRAPHRRDRVFIIASNSQGLHRDGGIGHEGESGRDSVPEFGDGGREKTIADTYGWRSGEIQTPVYSGLPDGNIPICESGQWDATNPTDLGLPNAIKPGAEGKICREMVKEGDNAECRLSIKTAGRRRAPSDTNCKGLQESEQSRRREDSEETGSGVDDRVERSGSDGPSAYTDSGGYARAEKRRGEREREYAFWGNRELLQENKWRYDENGDWVPTVSPVHRGNDGLPFSLDDLAISATKWRTESLKAYGNAIVPQVMYRIFQAIESIENGCA